MQVSRTKFIQNFEKFKNESFFNFLQKVYSIDFDVLKNKIEKFEEKFDVFEIMPKFDLDASDFYNWALKSAIIGKISTQSVDDFVFENQIIEKDYTLEYDFEKITVIYGNLTINGNFNNKGRIIVFGDLIVNGYWLDTYTDISEAVIIGNVKIKNWMLTEGTIAISGKLECPYVYFSYNQGFGTILEGCTSELFLEKDHGSSCILGKFVTKYLVFDELKTEFKIKQNFEEFYKNLDNIFNNEFAVKIYSQNEGVDIEDVNIDPILDEIYQSLSEGKNVFYLNENNK